MVSGAPIQQATPSGLRTSYAPVRAGIAASPTAGVNADRLWCVESSAGLGRDRRVPALKSPDRMSVARAKTGGHTGQGNVDRPVRVQIAIVERTGVERTGMKHGRTL